jgi:hypothetical protein
MHPAVEFSTLGYAKMHDALIHIYRHQSSRPRVASEQALPMVAGEGSRCTITTKSRAMTMSRSNASW